MVTRIAALAVCFAVMATPVCAKGGGAYGSYSSGTHGHPAQGVKRDAEGRIARSSAAKHEFQKAHPCPSTGLASGSCPGYIIDHVVPLKRGGADAPSNMQWQTEAEARTKDRWE
jgi:hypothetical protein